MKDYKNYHIPEVKDLTSNGNPHATYPNIFCNRDDGIVLNIAVTIEDISMMSEDDANEMIYKYACKTIDAYEAEMERINSESETSKEPETKTDDNNKDEETPAETKTGDEEFSDRDIQNMVKQAQEMLKIMESNWNAVRNEFKLTDGNMKELYQWNEQHRVPPADNMSEEEMDKYDHFNGIDCITEEEVVRIFGDDHPIIGVDFEGVTKVRIKDAIEDFFNYLSAMKEFRMIYDAYMKYMEAKEDKDIDTLKVYASNEKDPEKKAKMEEAIADYYYQKNLDFIPKELSDKTIKTLVDSYGDGKKLSYWMNRTQDKLKSMKLNSKFLLEISQFEKRFLPSQYHKMSNVFLEWFINYVTFSDVTSPKSKERARIASVVFALDSIIQNRCSEDFRTNVLYNITEFLDQLICPITERYFPDTESTEEGDDAKPEE